MARIRVAVVFGGRSSEHAVSCISAASVLRALDPERYDAIPIGITTDGRWVTADVEPSALEMHGRELPAVPTTGDEVTLVTGGLRVLDQPGVPSDVDVVFPVLHGPYGEDGTVQGLFEMAGVPYVGSGVFASAASMDKQHMKALLRAEGLPIGPYTVLRPGDPVEVSFDGPWFVKPARAGSSMGISKVVERDGLPAAVAAARRHDPKVVVEGMIVGREIECGVLGGDPPSTSVPAEIHLRGHDFYDFDAKYLPDEGTTFDIPADLDVSTTRSVQELAVRTFRAVDAEGIARVDFFLTEEGLVVNEINTMPGFTPTSMYPQMWAASGVSYAELVERLVQLALKRGTGLR
ncbi:MAG TPA: D-alanine--D-alanine ligase family protein [Mycobacteriales bacterium]